MGYGWWGVGPEVQLECISQHNIWTQMSHQVWCSMQHVLAFDAAYLPRKVCVHEGQRALEPL